MKPPAPKDAGPATPEYRSSAPCAPTATAPNLANTNPASAPDDEKLRPARSIVPLPVMTRFPPTSDISIRTLASADPPTVTKPSAAKPTHLLSFMAYLPSKVGAMHERERRRSADNLDRRALLSALAERGVA